MKPSIRALERKAEDDIAWQRCREQVVERAGGEISEVTGRPAGDAHHIDGRKAPMRDWPEQLKQVYPHCPLNVIILTDGEHRWAHQATKSSVPLLFAWLLHKYGDLMYKGKTYREWLTRYPPFIGYL